MSTNTTVVKRWPKGLPLALIILSIGLILSYFVIAQPSVFTWSPSIAAGNPNSVQLGIDADAARYTAMAKYYAEKEAIRNQLSLEADAARYTAMAKYYMNK